MAFKEYAALSENAFRKLLCILLSPIIYLVAIFYPKTKDKYCFGSWFGKLYSDNSRYLYEAANDADGIDAIWITKSVEVQISLEQRGLKVFHAYSIQGLFHQLSAELMFCSVNSRDFNPFCIGPNTTLIQLWHGLPLKKIGYDVKTTVPKRLRRWFRGRTVDSYSYVISPSYNFDEIFCSAFNIPVEKIIRAPYPRCVGMFQFEGSQAELKLKYGISLDKKVALYLPTHRDEGKTITVISDTVSELVKYENVLDRLNIQIVIKLHFYDTRFIDVLKTSKNVICIYEDVDIYPLLSISDLLITDYSSVIFDYYYLKKPVIIHAPDLVHYKLNNRELYLDICDFFIPDSQTVTELLNQLEFMTHDLVGEADSLTRDFGLVDVNENNFGSECLFRIRKYLNIH